MKVDKTKLKKTPTEAVSIQKFALSVFSFQKKILVISSPILTFPNTSSLIIYIYISSVVKAATFLETNFLLN